MYSVMHSRRAGGGARAAGIAHHASRRDDREAAHHMGRTATLANCQAATHASL